MAICLAAPFAGLVLCELLVRHFGIGPAPRPTVEGTVFVQAKAPLLYENGPGLERVSTLRDSRRAEPRRVVQRTNNQRMRGAEVALPKPEGVWRLVCVGDSHTFGDGVSDGETWPSFLADELARRFPGRRIEVVNAGVNGYDTVQEGLWIQHRVLELEPDGILLQYSVNDAWERGLTNAEVSHGWLLRLTHPRRGGAVARLRARSELVDAVFEGVFRQRYLERYGAVNSRRIESDHPRWRASREALARIGGVLAGRDVDFAVVLFPLLVTSGSGLASDPAFAIVGEVLAGQGIAHHDTSGDFCGRALIPLRLAPGDSHAGPDGYRIFARSVAGWIEKAGWGPAAGAN